MAFSSFFPSGDIERKQVVPISRGNTPCKCIHIADGSKKKSICTMAKNKESLLAKVMCSD